MKVLKKNLFIIPFSIILILSIGFGVYSFTQPTPLYKNYNYFLSDINGDNVLSVTLDESDKITIKSKDGLIYTTDNPNSLSLKEDLLKQNITVNTRSYPSPLKIFSILLGLTLIGSTVFVLSKKNSKGAKGMLNVESIEVHNIENYKYNFDCVAGNDEVKESVKDIVDFLKNPEKYNKYGARMPKGIILYGAPGTGKTLMAKAVAGEANVPFFALSGSDFVQLYVGVGASRIRNVFKKAKKTGRAVIFIDEIDAIGKKRSNGKAGGSDERDQTLNALLTEMSGFSEADGIVVMAATNRLDTLDDALLRPGRFDRHIEVPLPDITARESIIKLHLENKPYTNIDIKALARKTSYFSGAKIENLINESAILACKDESEFIEEIHLDKAFSIVIAGYEKINTESLREEDKKLTAYHESGHALISNLVLPYDKISKITIIPTSKGAGGYTLTIPEDSNYQTYSYLHNKIMVLLAGRAAEEIVFGKDKITTGAYNDLKHATSIISTMVTQYGMGDSLGLLSLNELNNIGAVNTSDILCECKNIVNSLYDETKNLILDNKDLLNSLAENLILKETLYEKDIYSIVA
ncbi:ATP-dependent metallopeptidase FtsH/Yme1/Tma family protein [Clostridium frigidicarnis]|uniref:Membrane protease FtsH catalytic subunit n=1 Tax=Clostridium frigidicarnis TaxID=84698 RepID=A0A1I0WY31_9CLOT|nr:FtsH/Yme1/Tma family ATP-dependent metallopeptidase [Clostridium frigidicarnis]SFA93307.1 membrane protease FtsH catalytic subunit [Clostridium frigidicarnis]